ncbi:MAG: hypothetical protein LBM97_01145, partial [Candidatus Nomurabacteria bacterium]|nr:hypothetical protein [Candidatus Nomurabacteria bacterium]
MKKVSKILAGTIAGLALALSLAFAPFATIVGAACNTSGSGGASTSDPDCIGSGGIQGGANAIQNDAMSSQLFGPDGTVTKIITIVVFIIGALCVGFLVFGGIQYI